jgi:molybdate transport system substrate-binding protein
MKWFTAGIVTLALLPVISAQAETLLVLAASSTTDAITEIGALYTKKSGHRVQFSFASAGALARQIQSGAPADIFVSANEQWMDVLQQKGKILPATRIDLLSNRLVLIAPRSKPFVFAVESGTALSAAFSGRMAVGEMEGVPAGIYAKQVLQTYGWLEALEARLVGCDSVRRALFFVERGEVDAGIVYASDAKLSDRVRVVCVFPAESHAPIRYPAALCAASAQPAVARDFLAFLQLPESAAIFERHGFEK